MAELIDQINFFHFLKLKPICEKINERWESEIEKNLSQKKMRECYVLLEKINPNDFKKSKLKRKRKIKKCCVWCN